MSSSARIRTVVPLAGAARGLAAAALLVASALATARAADVSGDLKALLTAAYFSPACAAEAARLGIAGADPELLIAAFAQSFASGEPDARAERRAAGAGSSGSVDCRASAVALVNLLRANGIAAELVLVSYPAGTASAPPDKVDGPLVYVPALGRYVDPAATEMRNGVSFDRMIKLAAVRVHLIGPMPGADPAHDVCSRVCMNVIGAGAADAIAVVTDVVRP